MRGPIKKAPSPELGETASQPRRIVAPVMANVIEAEIEGTLLEMGCSDLEIAGMAFAIASGHERAADTAARIIAARLSTGMRAMQIEDANKLVGDGSVDFF